MALDDPRRANLANWDERVPIHVASEFYDVEGFREGGTALRPVDIDGVGDVSAKRLLHLQCHFGLETLSWARLGAQVTGLDFSSRAIRAARELAIETGLDARFVEAELYRASEVLDERFDIVFTGCGALCWLPDIAGWARVVADLLEPGGMLYVREGHPMLWSLDDQSEDDSLVVRFPYFETTEALRFDEPTTYADSEPRLEHSVTYVWNHGLGEVVTALIACGLQIRSLREHRECDWKALPHMVQREDGMWRMPDGQRDWLPLMYSIVATR